MFESPSAIERERTYLDVALLTNEMGRKVRSEHEWFTWRTRRAARTLFFGSFWKQEKRQKERERERGGKAREKKSEAPVHAAGRRIVLRGLPRPKGRRAFSTQKNQQQPQRAFSNRALRRPISAATLMIDTWKDKGGEKKGGRAHVRIDTPTSSFVISACSYE